MEQKKKILLVDDQKDTLESMEYILSHAGYNVLTASSGKEAVLRAEDEQPDLILLDIRMPDMDGVKTTDILKSHQSTAKIPIAYLSNVVSERAVQKDGHVAGAKIGDLYFIPKTYSPEKILEFVKRSLEQAPNK
jgi:CheY-like chemotaxis protein